MRPLMVINFLMMISLLGCSGDSSNPIAGLLCGSGHAKGKMTVGLDLDLLKGVLSLTEDEGVKNDDIKTYLNDGLKSIVDPSILSIKNVDSLKSLQEVDGEQVLVADANDKVRYLQLDGIFGDGFGVASDLFKQFSLKTSNPFEFISESYNVAAAKFNILETSEGHPDQWAYRQTEYDKAKALYEKLMDAAGDESQTEVTVAVLDTGVDLEHRDLKDILVDGYNAIDESKTPDDVNGHGTHCAGIIAAQGTTDDSPTGVAKMANVKIMPVKTLGDNGSGDFQAIEKGIRFATQKGVDVISLSLGAGLEYSDIGGKLEALQNGVVKEAIDAGIIVIVAAGNENCQLGGSCEGTGLFSKTINEYTVLPCAYENTICIGATDADETLASYSNYSSKKAAEYRTKADVNAPGTAIYSTWPEDQQGPYKTISGTSMATPYVAGVAAIMKSVDKNLTQTQILDYLKRGEAKPEDIVSKSEVGRVDLYATLVALAKDKNVDGITEDITPEPNQVDAPETAAGNDGDALTSLFSAICQ